MVDKERNIMRLPHNGPSQGVVRSFAMACREWAGSAIPAGFVVRAGVASDRSFETGEVVHTVRLVLRLGGDEEMRSTPLLPTEEAMRAWARQAAKDMAHVLLMRAGIGPCHVCGHTRTLHAGVLLPCVCPSAGDAVANAAHATVGKERADGARITHGRAHGNAPAE